MSAVKPPRPKKKRSALPPPGRRVSAAEAAKRTNQKFDEDLAKLAK